MRRQQAIELLKEISIVCGESMQIDSVSLNEDEIHKEAFSQGSELTDSSQAEVKVYLRTDLDLNNEKCLADILQKHGLKMAKDNNFTVIYSPSN